jgi:hypothetical protein
VKRVYQAANLMDAQIVRDLLTQSGMAAEVFNSNGVGGVGEFPVSLAWPEVWVRDPDQEVAARALIAAHVAHGERSGEHDCPHCAESNPIGFLSCWSCGGTLPEG